MNEYGPWTEGDYILGIEQVAWSVILINKFSISIVICEHLGENFWFWWLGSRYLSRILKGEWDYTIILG